MEPLTTSLSMAALIKIFKKEAPENGNADITGYGAKSFKQFLLNCYVVQASDKEEEIIRNPSIIYNCDPGFIGSRAHW